MTREGLVDRVVDDLVNQVMEARRTRGSDVHAGPFTDRLKALQNRDVFGAVRHSRVSLVQRAATPRPGTQKSWSEGVFPVPLLYQNSVPETVLARPFHGVFPSVFLGPFPGRKTTMRTDVTSTLPHRSLTPSASAFPR